MYLTAPVVAADYTIAGCFLRGECCRTNLSQAFGTHLATQVQSRLEHLSPRLKWTPRSAPMHPEAPLVFVPKPLPIFLHSLLFT